MALRNSRFNIHTGIVFTLFLYLMCAQAARAERISISTNLGRITVPEGWEMEQVSQSHIAAWSVGDDSARIDLYSRDSQDISEYLHERADELHISRYVRSVSHRFLEEVGADRGGFVLGLVPADRGVAPVALPEEWDSLEWEDVAGHDARYLFVVAYELDGRLFTLEAETLDLSDGPILLADVHRSWRMP